MGTLSGFCYGIYWGIECLATGAAQVRLQVHGTNYHFVYGEESHSFSPGRDPISVWLVWFSVVSGVLVAEIAFGGELQLFDPSRTKPEAQLPWGAAWLWANLLKGVCVVCV